MVLDGLPGLYDKATACGLPLYLCPYKLVGSAMDLGATTNTTRSHEAITQENTIHKVQKVVILS